MKAREIPYGICRLYLEDLPASFPPDLRKKLLGACRARDLRTLAGASELVDVSLQPVDVVRALRQVSAFFKKNADYADDAVCLANARSAFIKAESKCRRTNKRLEWYFLHRDRLDPDMQIYLSRMEQYVNTVLGPYSLFLSGLPKRLRVTGGAASTRSRRKALPYMKVSKRPVCTPGAARYLQSVSEFLGYGQLRPRYTNVNRVEFVPKNWKTHRTIACEPEGNLPLQLAFDDYVKARLRLRAGIDLGDQSRNQRLAEVASKDGSLATIDLAAASDTLSFNLVAWLLPRDWFEYLRDIRASAYAADELRGVYAKFSSMGNGATFTLETLVFAAACKAVGSKRFSVYGDDIIIETELVPELQRLLAFVGFTINEEKSFAHGHFRESCGADYLNGVNVTPFYIRSWTTKKWTLAHNVNGLAGISLPHGKLWAYLKSLVISERLHFVPYNESSVSGVWIDVWHAYHLRLFRWRHSILKAKLLVSTKNSARTDDSRSLFLWYLDKYRVKRETSENIRSRVPTGALKYKRKWVCWWKPATGTPDHMYMWSVYVTGEAP